MSSIRQTAFDLVGRLKKATSHGGIYAELHEAKAVFGYDTFIITGLPRSPRESLDDCKLISGWPTEWERRYSARRFVQIDPVIAHIRGTADPFFWSEAVERAPVRDGMVVMDEARAFGLDEGLCVPFHQVDGSEAGVSFGGRQVRLSDDEKAALHLVALYAMSSARAIARRPTGSKTKDETHLPLTAREIECVKWASAGKTAWETSMILAVSSRTVQHHLANAARKMQAVSQAQCVAEAMRRGVIE